MAESIDSILRQFLMLKSADLGDELQMLPDGTFRITSPSDWQTIYEQFLRNVDITKFWSVAWVKTSDYGQDPLSQLRLQIDFDAVRRRVMLHRVVIVADQLWPLSDLHPQESLRTWVECQHDHGIWVGLVRESQIAHVSDLLSEFGIFGDRALAVREHNDEQLSIPYVLSFDAVQIQKAKARWKRMKTYAISYMTLLDQLESKE